MQQAGQPADQADILEILYDAYDEDAEDGEEPTDALLPERIILPPRVIRFVIDDLVYTIDGVSHTNDVAPFIDPVYGRTMVPLRAVSAALGIDVDWVSATRTVLIFTDAGVRSLPVDEPLPDGMGTPVIYRDRAFVPLRYVSELLGAEVRWDGANRVAYVYMV